MRVWRDARVANSAGVSLGRGATPERARAASVSCQETRTWSACVVAARRRRPQRPRMRRGTTRIQQPGQHQEPRAPRCRRVINHDRPPPELASRPDAAAEVRDRHVVDVEVAVGVQRADRDRRGAGGALRHRGGRRLRLLAHLLLRDAGEDLVAGGATAWASARRAPSRCR